MMSSTGYRNTERPRIGELFAGYGGLGMGVQAAIGGEIAWFSEFDPAPSKILAHHWPDVPNHCDITKIDWSTVEPVDILTGGFPCQDVSLAGARRGLKDGTRSGLWSYFDGLAYELPTLELRTDVSDSSLLPTAGVVGGGKQIPEDAVWSGKAAYKPDGTKVQVHLDRIETLLKTPTAQLAVNGGSQHPDKRKEGGHGPTLADEVEHLLPTATARDWRSGKSNQMSRNARPLNEVIEMEVAGVSTRQQSDDGNPLSAA